MYVHEKFNFSSDGEDFAAGSEVVTFQPGETRACADFDIQNDEVVEDTEERFTVQIDEITPSSVEMGDNPTATVTITDDDCELTFCRKREKRLWIERGRARGTDGEWIMEGEKFIFCGHKNDFLMLQHSQCS